MNASELNLTADNTTDEIPKLILIKGIGNLILMLASSAMQVFT